MSAEFKRQKTSAFEHCKHGEERKRSGTGAGRGKSILATRGGGGGVNPLIDVVLLSSTSGPPHGCNVTGHDVCAVASNLR